MDTEEKFPSAAKRVLDEAEKNLDAGTIARLRAARRQALEEGLRRPSRPAWLLPVGGLATAGVVLAVAGLLWFSAPNTTLMQASMGDLELLTAQESPDFFADLDFYDWLEHDTDAS
jgi:hypothetical protein